MSYREPVNKKEDQKIYKRTAVKIKKINVNAKPMRGGIRL